MWPYLCTSVSRRRTQAGGRHAVGWSRSGDSPERLRRSSEHAATRALDLGEPNARVRCAHERLSDQHGVDAGGSDAGEILAGREPAFRYPDDLRGHALEELEGVRDVDLEGTEIPVVHAEHVDVVEVDFFEIFCAVCLDEDREAQFACSTVEVAELALLEGGRDQEHGVGAEGAGLPPSVPYLAGQYAGYMELQLQLWKAGIRDNDSMNVMSTIARKMDEEDMRAVSEYYARVRPPEQGDPDVAVEVELDVTAGTE